MSEIILDEFVSQLFSENRKCIVNADLDGLLSGMLLQYFLKWSIVGFSYCSGSQNEEEVWLCDENEYIEDCVFVDLPVVVPEISVIDQHFVSLNGVFIKKYESTRNKLNPNVMKKLTLKKNYGDKYPFGTVHFILAILENLGKIDESFVFGFTNKIEDFILADLFYRADGVIDNACKYAPNCKNWAQWLMRFGKKNTNVLFSVVEALTEKEDAKESPRVKAVKSVEKKLMSFGCSKDGDCSVLFRKGRYDKINEYFKFLSNSLKFTSLPLVYQMTKFGRLYGERISTIDSKLSEKCNRSDTFSYAFVKFKELSITYIRGK